MTLGDTSVSDAAEALRRGRPVVFPTETVYGLGVAVGFAQSPDEVYELKRRSRRKPIAWLIADAADLETYGADVPAFAKDIARSFWPGPLTLVVRASDAVPAAFRSPEGTIGLRMPDNPTALELIRLAGCPLATTSANRAGFPAPRSLEEIDGDFARAVGLVVSDDREKTGVASTILDCTGDHPQVLRAGAITVADIAARS